ncbi:SDR family oxidoreductase [Bythopirellula polymerisocia]|uniref:Linear gramicidin synthase subunit D n=1 Tax=Bythopirellula polymerisocia TaxID=2528003 RepID=A0A5C6CLV1_9BACT|nr:SDR family oxidoreductase [Bythopirellula polymerisocia]TWU25883.1 Linear gramicidin synthase subunit D [Bythopirellula polymerisocia]
MKKYTLLTGSTGLLGRYLLRDLLLAGKRIAVVVRTSQRQTVQQRIEDILQFWEKDLPSFLSRPIYLSGNITEDFLGLDEKSRQWVSEFCDTIIHSAASLTFLEEPDGEPWKTNVGGTRNVLQLCRDTNIRKLHYVSTAYVCGMREDRVYESELDRGQAFRNDYEKSKLQAEQLIRDDDHIDELTVYRPAVIAGDSQSGYTNTYHGLFLYLKIMCILARNTQPGSDGVRRTEVQLHLTGDEQRNVIPVDWAAAVITHLFCTPEAHGHTFHLAPRVRMTPRQMIEAGCSYFNSTGVEFIGHAEELDLSDGDLQRHAYENSTLYRDYEYSDPEFDTTNLERFAGHLPCPPIDEAMFHRFMKYGEEDNWGKRRLPMARKSFDVAKFLQRAVALSQTTFHDQTSPDQQSRQILGLDLTGPGGGQWTITLNSERIIAVEPGIAATLTSEITLPVELLAAPVQVGSQKFPTDKLKSAKPISTLYAERLFFAALKRSMGDQEGDKINYIPLLHQDRSQPV